MDGWNIIVLFRDSAYFQGLLVLNGNHLKWTLTVPEANIAFEGR